MVKFAIDGILGFSTIPLKMISQLGMLLSLFSFIGILYAVYVRIFDPTTTVPGWTFIVIAILIVGGIQLMMLGVLGAYIGRMYAEIQKRPLYIVSAVYSDRKTKQNINSL
jgi:dolichol-phosphate mannosyltransferase